MATSSGGGSSKAVLTPEITAEWTVHAQLTLSHQGSSSACDKPTTTSTSGIDEPDTATNSLNENPATGESAQSSGTGQRPPPVKVVYKFSTADPAATSGNGITAAGCCNNSGAVPNATATAVTFKQQDGSSIFNSIISDASSTQVKQTGNEDNTTSQSTGDSGLSNHTSSASGDRPILSGGTATTSLPLPSITITPQLFPKCTSTCSIVLTADLLPPSPGGTDPTVITINKAASTGHVTSATADKFTCFPEKPSNEGKDVSCQTSDIEAAIEKMIKASGDDLQKLHQKAAEALLSPVMARRDDKYGSLTRKSPLSPANILSPSNTLLSQRSKDGTKKKPRTVHIDVYCTGSDADSSSSSDESSVRTEGSSSSSGSRFDTSHLQELKSTSNVTHPTIYESEEMKLRHRRATKHEVPRRVAQQTVDQSTLSTIGSLKKAGAHNRKPIKRSNTKEEINESKQILFNKILGDQQDLEPLTDLQFIPRDQSDDNLSSNYPFSNRSAKRDITGSSLSSALASASFDEVGDLEEAAGGISNLHRSGTIVTHSDSFEYENSEDRYRIHEMEERWGRQKWKSPSVERIHEMEERWGAKTWKSPSVERRLLEIHNPVHLRTQSESDNNGSESDHSFIYDSPCRPEESVHSMNEFSDSSPSTVKSCSNRTPSNVDNSKRIFQQALLNANNSSNTFPPRTWSPVEGYSNEYLSIARRFGSLITGKRKPGLHIGPVRNPECQCEHCRRWVVEREGGLRERALSVDDTPFSNIVDMRRKFHFRNHMLLP
ncbi:uncharacterized protein LOC129756721 [Uranotaenia lowii]|uniref:uncharacterized protein LOC129756721 n=1 Tax=Uranotaenia lowii TaxID=190385 RepID=UPI00247A7B08|nr:uncharacterized protein LOC129756721 [Uranotaenia lowii]XP_055609687.1 uncharacterized protein LOC129756721 [Uranotaenia lowii]XP_055609688.1 uncharacterized protein LOC129756721 [Uranotaenia lowii]XP_055609689.1 uncharacterized protein LOC129756721 [Uranotaenia lowii]XP_055609690.1 uncharacterized protein LOC129756721 [Uranotaenia lowii]XP_055609691.1 uncharacterized protein LOC129756721 [Uranotaenia lowii]